MKRNLNLEIPELRMESDLVERHKKPRKERDPKPISDNELLEYKHLITSLNLEHAKDLRSVLLDHLLLQDSSKELPIP